MRARVKMCKRLMSNMSVHWYQMYMVQKMALLSISPARKEWLQTVAAELRCFGLKQHKGSGKDGVRIFKSNNVNLMS